MSIELEEQFISYDLGVSFFPSLKYEVEAVKMVGGWRLTLNLIWFGVSLVGGYRES